MKTEPRWPRRHPLCDCPERTAWPYGIAVDRERCRGGSIAHPQVGMDELRAMIAQLQTRGSA